MKTKIFVFAAVTMLALPSIASPVCYHKLYGNQVLERRTLSVPTKILARVVEKVVPRVGLVAPDIEITLEFLGAIEFKLVCNCTPCCQVPAKQVASLSVSASIQAFGGTVLFVGAATREQEGKELPSETELCSLAVTLGYQKGTLVPAVGIGLSLGGVSLRTERVSLSFSAIPQCGCTDNPACFGNTAPQIVEISPPWVDLNKGASATITVKASDVQGNLADFPSKIEGEGLLPVTLITQRFNEARTLGQAEYRVDFPKEGEELRGLLVVVARDVCGQGDTKKVGVRLFYPPVLVVIPEGSGWHEGTYALMYRVEDPDFKGCNEDRLEVVRIFVEEVKCGETYPPELSVSCWCVHEECRMGGVSFTPERDCCDRWLKVVAEDSSPAGAQRDILFVRVPNRAPTLEVNPGELKVKPGETRYAHVAATDPDGDTVVTLTQTSGPGSFARVKEEIRESERGTWSWKVPEKLRSFSAWATFVAMDLCNGVGYGFLHVHTVNPPQASDAHAIVPRGGRGKAYAYVHDPDSPWVSASLGPVPPGLAVSASVEDDPFAPGLGGFMVVFRVAADPTLCEGVYTIPFTVTDPDGLSSSATLEVRVVGNRPPVASPPDLKGETTVVLTPEGVVRKPVVFQRIEVWDPDGDRVTVEGYGIPPTYAANLSAFLGSLWALSTPGGLTVTKYGLAKNV